MLAQPSRVDAGHLQGAMPVDACTRLLRELPRLVVLRWPVPLIYCPTAKAGTTTMSALLKSLLDGLPMHQHSPRPIVASSYIIRHGAKESLANYTEVGRMDPSSAEAFCRRGAVSFTIARNPWTRLLSAYMGKVADDAHPGTARFSLAKMREWYGLAGSAPVSFGQFVRWLRNNASDDNAHWRPHEQQCAPSTHPYSLIGQIETLDGDLLRLLRLLGLPERLATDEHISSAAKCRASERCAASLRRQVGPDWASLQPTELLARMYRSEPGTDLRSLVRRYYTADVRAHNYSFPSSRRRPATRVSQ